MKESSNSGNNRLWYRYFSRLYFVIVIVGSLCYSQPQNWSHHTSPVDYSNWTRAMAMDNYGNLLVLGNTPVLVIFLKSEMDQCASKLSEVGFRYAPDYIVNCSLRDEIWLFCYDTLFVYAKGDYSRAQRKQLLTFADNVTGALELSDSSVIVSTKTKLYRYQNAASWQQIVRPSAIQEDMIPCLEDSRGYAWFKTAAQGLFRYKNGIFESFNTSNTQMTSNKFNMTGTVMIEDGNGNIITGTLDNETDKSAYYIYNGSTWTRKLVSTTCPNCNSIMCCALDSTGALWFGTNDQLARVYHDSTKLYTLNDHKIYGAPRGYVRDIIVDRENRAFFGTFHFGVYMLEQNGYSCKNTSRILRETPPDSSLFQAGDTMKIIWKSFGLVDSVVFQYRQDGQSWELLLPHLKKYNNVFAYSWKMPELNPGKYYLRISDFKNSAITDSSCSFYVRSTGENTAPVFVNLPETVSVYSKSTNDFTVNSFDRDGDEVHCSLSAHPLWVSITDNRVTLTPDISSESFRLQVIISDGKGGMDTGYVAIVVEPPVHAKSGSTAMNNRSIMLVAGTHCIFFPEGDLQELELYTLKGEKLFEIDYTSGKSVDITSKLREKYNGTAIFIIKAAYSAKNIQKKIMIAR